MSNKQNQMYRADMSLHFFLAKQLDMEKKCLVIMQIKLATLSERLKINPRTTVVVFSLLKLLNDTVTYNVLSCLHSIHR